MKQSPVIIYLQLRKHVKLPIGQAVRLRDIARVLTDAKLEPNLLDVVIKKPEEQDGNLVLIDMLQIIASIQARAPAMQVEYIGEPQVLVEMVRPGKKPLFLLFILVWLLLFFGSALTIMNFHADVSMQAVQVRIVEMITGERDEHPYLFQGAYSIGIGFGMVVFFNHLFKKKWNEEPTPLEVEMYLYQENLNQFVISEEYKKMYRAAERGEKEP
ncbi:stage V sporulation protein AA [Paenibacillus lentus]|uniref:Stage V sporulation protein AA n=1 Tax=Paenibacillus lentus TaxID=1338368 RepID=A0A3Q8SBR5_9BACL|nr:stage V sporulation protein AA [Paenibacillus lentus]AZK47103.1 stage V sporulation protein AA [Paenibacillus lentus]